MTPIQALRRARALIADSSHWCQGVYAFGKSGRRVAPRSRCAVRWCAIGAVVHATDGDIHAEYGARDALTEAADRLYPSAHGLADVNDALGHTAVLRCFQFAIQQREEEEATP